jgi:hypothetical protein
MIDNLKYSKINNFGCNQWWRCNRRSSLCLQNHIMTSFWNVRHISKTELAEQKQEAQDPWLESLMTNLYQ